jgi:murein DD-endopeptidase
MVRLSAREVFGLSPVTVRLREAMLTFRGDAFTPKSRFDRTSLKVLRPALSIALWLGRNPSGRKVAISNFFSHAQPPPELGWSVRVTTARDFRGKQGTYDSHNGTDFAVSPGTTIVAAAAGKVLRIASEFNRGGLKIFIDHGNGIVTTSNHLGRALVKVGQLVERSEPIALSGVSGIDGLLLFPFSAPHVHFNVWLNGTPVDPFSIGEELSLWHGGNDPRPWQGEAIAHNFKPTAWDEGLVEAAIESCLHVGAQREMRSFQDLGERAMAVLFHANYYPTRFPSAPTLYRKSCKRLPVLTLPLSSRDFDGIAWSASSL